MIPLSFYVILLVIQTNLLFCSTNAGARSIHIALHASWNATAPSAEAVKHIYDVWGTKAAIDFIQRFNDQVDTVSSSNDPGSAPFSETAERQLIFDAFSKDFQSLSVPTLRWVLSARVHSPHVRFQYSLARRAIGLFPNSQIRTPPVFAVLTSITSDSAKLILNSNELANPSQAAPSVRYPPLGLALRNDDHIPLSLCSRSDVRNSAKPLLVLYGHLPNPSFSRWFHAASVLAEACTHNVVLRFAPPDVPYPPPRLNTPLSGFAASVTLRKTEYNVVDDRSFSSRLFSDCPPGLTPDECTAQSTEGDKCLLFSWAEPTPSPSNATLPRSTASRFVIMRGGGDVDRTLDALSLISEDAPAVMRSAEYLTGDHVTKDPNKEFEGAVKAVRSITGDGDLILINGFKVDLLSVRQGPTKLLRCLSAFSSAANVLLRKSTKELQVPLPMEQPDTPHRFRVLLPVHEKAPKALVWFNDMFSDTRYSKWPSLNLSDRESIEDFASKVEKQRLKPASEATLHLKLVKVRAHHLHMFLIVDPGDIEHLPFLSVPESVVRADLPIRVGAVLIPNGRVSELAAGVFYHLLRLKGRKTAVQFIGMLRQVVDYVASATGAVSMTDMMVNMAFQQVGPRAGSRFRDADDILQEDEDVKRDLEQATSFAKDMRLYVDVDSSAYIPEEQEATKKVSFLCVLNGIVLKDVAREALPIAIKEQERVASLLANGFFDGEELDDFQPDYWVKKDDSILVVNRLSRDLRSGESPRSNHLPKKMGVVPVPARDILAVQDHLSSVEYLSTESGDDFNLTVWLAGTDRGSETFNRTESLVQQLSQSNFARQTGMRVAILKEDTELHDAVLSSVDDTEANSVIIVNGRRILGAAVEDVEDLFVEIATDFEIVNIPSNMKGDSRLFYSLYSREISEACTFERRDSKISTELILTRVKESAPALSIPEELIGVGDEGNSFPLTALAVVDPANPNAYVTVSVLKALRSAYSKEDLSMGLVIAPELGSMKKKLEPPNTFQRFLLPADDLATPRFPDRFSGRISFNRLPQRNVLTVSVEPPRAWFVSSHMTNYDMDNVILDNISGEGDLFTEYQLMNLIVEGSCVDESGRPPQGLKLVLANEDGVVVDTLVMANLGYFQLKVPTPGLWWLSLAGGASSRIFMLRSMEMFKDNERLSFESDANGRVSIPVESLSGAGGILLHVARRPGMEGKSVLDPDSGNRSKDSDSEVEPTEGNDVVNKFKKTVRGLFQRKTPLVDEDDLSNGGGDIDTINVFSVASGHLYERFLKIMISSVTKNASRKVKFWLLENYLSPSFKKLLPEFAKEHGAEVGMVTYRWPGWLRAQTEKQRIIWAYKILFLDVLFPLDVGRIIFVDSDQVIRGDLAELMDIDLQGAPYGYVPFCDSRKEVEGYRFWKTGFWKETLQGAKYRISALYVVDLNRFRETAAGDTLRFIYQSLSADPNSLSNLDQDLPNYASVASMTGSTVPIFDLPEEWLWCETWCDDESKTRAKAIDLCNNPDTKEPKLDSAKRIISEWVELDNRASELTESIYKRLLLSDRKNVEVDDTGKTEL